AGIDEPAVDLFGCRRRAHAKDAVLGMKNDFALGRHIVGHLQRRAAMASAMVCTILLIIEYAFPARGAACNVALQIRDRDSLGACEDPGSAAHPCVLRCTRETCPVSSDPHPTTRTRGSSLKAGITSRAKRRKLSCAGPPPLSST